MTPDSLDPTTNPDAQEALSRHYSNAAVLVLPLRSGRFAIIDRGYNLHIILDNPPTANELRALSLSFETVLAAPVLVNPQIFHKLETLELDLDLDLNL
jgi:hypothetical protein